MTSRTKKTLGKQMSKGLPRSEGKRVRKAVASSSAKGGQLRRSKESKRLDSKMKRLWG